MDKTSAMAAKTKMIIDCDTGVDDAVALLLALQATDKVELLAITCVNGNCAVDEAFHNTLITLKIAQRSVPVYKGCSKPLSAIYVRTTVHGSDGLGGVAHEYTPCEESGNSKHAVNVLVDLVNQHPGEITLVALGPLTNLAVAYRMDEKFSSKLKRLVIMGGNTQGKGNDTLAAEYNFHVDPEAAQIVVEETLCDCSICGWEVTGLETVVSWEWFESWVAKAKDKRGIFIKNIVKSIADYRKKSGRTSFGLCDPAAMAVAIYPDVVMESMHRKVTVETAGASTRGMMAIEWREGQLPRKHVKPRELVVSIDIERYKQLLLSLM